MAATAEGDSTEGNPQIQNHAAFIWSVADLLRGDYKQSEYGRVILPFTVLRRLDCVLAPVKADMLTKHGSLKGRVENVGPVLDAFTDIDGLWNTSPFDLPKLLDAPDDLSDNLRAYIAGFSPQARDILEKFDFPTQIRVRPRRRRGTHPSGHGADLRRRRLAQRRRRRGADHYSGAGRLHDPEEMPLTEIIARINERHGTNLDENSKLLTDQIANDLVADSRIQNEAGANDEDSFSVGFDKTWRDGLVDRLGVDEDFGYQLLDDEDLRAALVEQYRPVIYARARVARQRTCPIGDLIGPDREDLYLEYKSTLRWDLATEQKASYLEDGVIKTIAGFANAPYGGTLLVGVADEGSIVGLEHDYTTFSARTSSASPSSRPATPSTRPSRPRPRPTRTTGPRSGGAPRWAPWSSPTKPNATASSPAAGPDRSGHHPSSSPPERTSRSASAT